MLVFLLILVGIFYATKQLWLYYIAGMHLVKLRDAALLTREQTFLGYCLLAEGLLLDLVFHVVIGSVLFWELPARGEWTLSARLWRLSNAPEQPDDWRRRLALTVRTKLLDSADKRGYHSG